MTSGQWSHLGKLLKNNTNHYRYCCKGRIQMEKVECITNCLLSLQIELGDPYHEGGFRLCRGRADPQAGCGSGSREGALAHGCTQHSSSGPRAVWEQRGAVSRTSASPVSAFSSWAAVTEHRAVCQQKEGSFFFSWLHKEAVRPSCSCNLSPAQLTKMYTSGTDIFLINFPITFYRCCKLHWSWAFSLCCRGLWLCNRAQSILCSQYRIFAT